MQDASSLGGKNTSIAGGNVDKRYPRLAGQCGREIVRPASLADAATDASSERNFSGLIGDESDLSARSHASIDVASSFIEDGQAL